MSSETGAGSVDSSVGDPSTPDASQDGGQNFDGGTGNRVCTPGTSQCTDAGSVQQCGDAGQWQAGPTCTSVCVNGQCAGTCQPGATQACGGAATCNAGGTQTCDKFGTWGPCSNAPRPCVATPLGWQPYATASGGVCPAGFTGPQAYISAVSAPPAGCGCSCSGTQVCTATGQLIQYSQPGCSGPATPLGGPINITSSCVLGGYGSVTAANYYAVTGVTSAATPSCGASSFVSSKPPAQKTTKELCSPALSCPNGACLDPGQEANLCVSKDGDFPCPTAYPTRTLVAIDSVDTRGCGPCACGSTLGCSLQAVNANNDSATCSANPYAFTMSGSSFCAQAPLSFPVNGIKGTFAASGSGTCSSVTSPAQPTGSVSLNPGNMRTVCCR